MKQKKTSIELVWEAVRIWHMSKRSRLKRFENSSKNLGCQKTCTNIICEIHVKFHETKKTSLELMWEAVRIWHMSKRSRLKRFENSSKNLGCQKTCTNIICEIYVKFHETKKHRLNWCGRPSEYGTCRKEVD